MTCRTRRMRRRARRSRTRCGTTGCSCSKQDGRYIDVYERAVYNAMLSGISLSGDTFFYPNPLLSLGQHERSPWFTCACCPSNLPRFMLSIPGHAYAVAGDRVFVNLFVQGRARVDVARRRGHHRAADQVPVGRGRQACASLRHGQAVSRCCCVCRAGRRAGRCRAISTAISRPVRDAVSLKVNGLPLPVRVESGFAAVTREWAAGDTRRPPPADAGPRRVVAHPAVKADEARVAVERGPLVYTAEFLDHGGRVTNLVLDDRSPLAVGWRPAARRRHGRDRQGHRAGDAEGDCGVAERAPHAHPVLRLGASRNGRDGGLARQARRQGPAGPGTDARVGLEGIELGGWQGNRGPQRTVRAVRLERPRRSLLPLVAEEGQRRVGPVRLSVGQDRVRDVGLLVRRYGAGRVPDTAELARAVQEWGRVAARRDARRVRRVEGPVQHRSVHPGDDRRASGWRCGCPATSRRASRNGRSGRRHDGRACCWRSAAARSTTRWRRARAGPIGSSCVRRCSTEA